MRALLSVAVFLFEMHLSLAQAADLRIGVTPAAGVLIDLRRAATCLDLQRYAKNGGQLAQSMAGPVVNFNDFSLELPAGDVFYIQVVEVTLKGRGFVGGSFSDSLLPDEIDALLGTDRGVINGPAEIHSSDKARKLPLAPCGLLIGGIAMVSDIATRPFNADVTVSVSGTMKKQDGRVSYITRSIKAKARFLGQT